MGAPAHKPPRAEPVLAVTRLDLTNFRNYPSLRLALAPRPVVLTGGNGAGKTNLLEAVSLLASGRGLRGAVYSELCCSAAPDQAWAVHGELSTGEGPYSIGTGFDPGSDSSARQVRINGVAGKSSRELGDVVRLVWLTPAMDRLFSGPASERRRFLDRLAVGFHPEHSSHVAGFEKAMRERNRLLENFDSDRHWLSALEETLSEHGAAVAAARLEAVQHLQTAMDHIRPDSPFPRAELMLEGVLDQWLAEGLAAVEVEDRYRALLADSRRRDGAAGRTLDGPHRSDLVVHHGGKRQPARLCSTGEQKALLLSLVLAHARIVASITGKGAPLMLLDEVAAHLDERHRVALYDEICALGAQAWLSGTDLDLFAPLEGRASFFTVTDGQVQTLTRGP